MNEKQDNLINELKWDLLRMIGDFRRSVEKENEIKDKKMLEMIKIYIESSLAIDNKITDMELKIKKLYDRLEKELRKI